MRLPTRKSELFRQQTQKDDNYMTKEAFDRLKEKLAKLEKSLHELAREVTRTQEMGDLSENAAYQEAKFALRKTMSQIENIKQRIKDVIIIDKPDKCDVVSIGSIVTVVANGKQKQLEILGSHESNPLKGRISHLSPIGQALLGHRSGDNIKIEIQGKEIEYEIITIE
ncbi:MAG: Transcription elongation factor [uncultured bacterium]|uniref:Transcription elongation factor GreA n=1 Tax=Candidatus Uhrbacteria bacterium GW2011_GWC1_41_20 TaxID=1618983 RepID=A0A0G0VFT6_9BACT|nr:MAG: Transcription elongation factor [uncultured bacterium]KKR23134.1 MAG: Transcription elongation factor GreA [Candidatus Uhrbacteria bacterium GW2011_GWE1_39_46]KKR64489.1 MAG: Transcription elongation factor GreA [Candidatus Uhrbacteria bacterium GW2011_GWC2_40_450]KKR90332.1 MAG: Transcription elongation factor GreA [Candidatus Uhrbacteria bacterium GW2011_GWE2_41_1153]KKR90561.1 MAG: Transcription elongation factor GreA [Candidatus Uhrbacteria bacterium GW2011_GWD2_41_121]KKR96472.1 M